MAFSSKQVRQLRARVPTTRVREREVEGKTLHYVEGWHVIAEANRIFGFDAWDRETVSSQCVWQKSAEGRYGASYITRVRLTVRAGDHVISREGLGSGEAFAPTAGQAHERAAKAAETDATKRALSTFGNRFGLSLYRDKQDQRPPARPSDAEPLEDPLPDSREIQAQTDPVAAESHVSPKVAVPIPGSADEPLGAAEASGKPQHAYRVSAPINAGGHGRVLETVRVSEHAPKRTEAGSAGTRLQLPVTAHVLPPARIPVDKSTLPIGEPKRIRSVDHLRFVAKQPCLVCGRQPAQAHHLRFAQPRALSRKVSDEFTVPLCNFHHDEVHRTGNEFQWWRARGLDPLQAARVYWAETRNFPGSSASVIDPGNLGAADPREETADQIRPAAAPP